MSVEKFTAKLRMGQRLKRIGERGWVTFPRCFLMTLGLLFSGIPLVVIATQGKRQDECPVWAWVLLAGLGIWGLCLVLIGLLADKRTTERWTRHSDSKAHFEVTLLVAVIAAPLFFILKLLERR